MRLIRFFRVLCAPFYFLGDARIVHPRGSPQIDDKIVLRI